MEFSFDVEKLESAIIDESVDRLISEREIKNLVKLEVEKRIDAIFAGAVHEQINAAIDKAVTDGFHRHFQAVSPFGVPTGKPTSIANMLEVSVQEYWATKVSPSTGSPSNFSDAITRAERVMMQICTKEFEAHTRKMAADTLVGVKDLLLQSFTKSAEHTLRELVNVKA